VIAKFPRFCEDAERPKLWILQWNLQGVDHIESEFPVPILGLNPHPLNPGRRSKAWATPDSNRWQSTSFNPERTATAFFVGTSSASLRTGKMLKGTGSEGACPPLRYAPGRESKKCEEEMDAVGAAVCSKGTGTAA
jgi:hypothetical protein